jgi:glutamate---cysteine ligase / carboxylate-amine ligase
MVDPRLPAEFLLGVEEEFLLIDNETRRPAPIISRVISDATRVEGDRAQKELHRAQIEIASDPCASLEQLTDDLSGLRRSMVAAAAQHGASVLATGTYPGEMGPGGRLITADERYESIGRENSAIATEQLICGCHIHVSVRDDDQAVQLMNRVRRWLPCLLALSANSPFWEAADTGYASYRTEVWSRWPTAGPTGEFASFAEYSDLLDRLVNSGVIMDRAMAYWDVRPSESFPTLEIRIADVMASTRTTVLVAGLAQGLVAWCSDEAAEWSACRTELVRAANWRAARSGLSGDLVDPLDATRSSASTLIGSLFDHLRPYLDLLGTTDQLAELWAEIGEHGNGADIQRQVYARRSSLDDVIDAFTLGEDGQPPLDRLA